MMQKDKNRIAFVCTGNTCRSPMAQGIFNRLACEKNLDVEAESFGATAVAGLSATENAIKACAEAGVDISAHTSTPVESVSLESYDMIYCMTQSHAKILTEYFRVSNDKIRVLNVSDPYGGNMEVYRKCRDEITRQIEGIIKEYENRKND